MVIVIAFVVVVVFCSRISARHNNVVATVLLLS